MALKNLAVTLLALSALLMVKWYGPGNLGQIRKAGSHVTHGGEGSMQIMARELEGEGEAEDDKKEEDKKEEAKKEEAKKEEAKKEEDKKEADAKYPSKDDLVLPEFENPLDDMPEIEGFDYDKAQTISFSFTIKELDFAALDAMCMTSMSEALAKAMVDTIIENPSVANKYMPIKESELSEKHIKVTFSEGDPSGVKVSVFITISTKTAVKVAAEFAKKSSTFGMDVMKAMMEDIDKDCLDSKAFEGLELPEKGEEMKDEDFKKLLGGSFPGKASDFKAVNYKDLKEKTATELKEKKAMAEKEMDDMTTPGPVVETTTVAAAAVATAANTATFAATHYEVGFISGILLTLYTLGL